MDVWGNAMEIHHPGSVSNGLTQAKREGEGLANPSVQSWQEAETSFPCYFKNTSSLDNAI